MHAGMLFLMEMLLLLFRVRHKHPGYELNVNYFLAVVVDKMTEVGSIVDTVLEFKAKFCI